jgi:hypothetical protein
MFSLKKLFSLVAICSIGLIAQAQTIKKADDVFSKWLEWQQIIPDRDLTTLQLTDASLPIIKTNYEKSVSLLAPLTQFLDDMTSSCISEYGYNFKPPISKALVENLTGIYQVIEHDMPSFIKFLELSQMVSSENKQSEDGGDSSHSTIEKYNALFNLVFANPDETKQNPYLFSVANRFFEYCFGEATFSVFQKMLLNKKNYPIARMLYSITWSNLAGSGWKHWSEQSLKLIKDKAAQGNQIVYIAGGSDIYQLIKAGVYNIYNIDPQLPSQPKYYANDWAFLIKGQGIDNGIGDQIIFTTAEGKNITMTRTGYQETGNTFKARMANGDIIELPHSISTWTFTDSDNKKLGDYVLDRRLCEQTDFEYAANKTLVMSFNELYFVSLPAVLNGWGIDPSRFSDKLSIIVKQLRKPVNKQMVVNMRIASLLNNTDFHFIALGTCIN